MVKKKLGTNELLDREKQVHPCGNRPARKSRPMTWSYLAGLKRAEDHGRKLERKETKRHFPSPLAFFPFS